MPLRLVSASDWIQMRSCRNRLQRVSFNSANCQNPFALAVCVMRPSAQQPSESPILMTERPSRAGQAFASARVNILIWAHFFWRRLFFGVTSAARWGFSWRMFQRAAVLMALSVSQASDLGWLAVISMGMASATWRSRISRTAATAPTARLSY